MRQFGDPLTAANALESVAGRVALHLAALCLKKTAKRARPGGGGVSFPICLWNTLAVPTQWFKTIADQDIFKLLYTNMTNLFVS